MRYCLSKLLIFFMICYFGLVELRGFEPLTPASKHPRA